MTEAPTYQPNWVSPPSDTIKDILIEKDLSTAMLTSLIGGDKGLASDLLNDKKSIDSELATLLSKTLGASSRFWLKRYQQYETDCERLKKEAEENDSWLKKFPVSDMIKFGWITANRKKSDRLYACLDFFNVQNTKQWYARYENLHMLAQFRTSSSYDSNPESVITWLRQGMILGSRVQCLPWNSTKFSEAVLKAKTYTRVKNPEKFIPEVSRLFASCGVALAIARTPSKCHASGATFFLDENKALLLLSFKYLSDDHFWFSLFHEAGHLLLHGKKSTFIEGLEYKDSKEEAEANSFSEQILIPSEYQDEFKQLDHTKWRQIIRFSKKIGVSPGIVVGQLQNAGLVAHDKLNKLKVRYKWAI